LGQPRALPEQALGSFENAYYQQAVEIELYVEKGDAAGRDAASTFSFSRSERRLKLTRRSAASPSA